MDKQMPFRMSPEFYTKLKIYLAKNNISFQKLVSDFLTDLLKDEE